MCDSQWLDAIRAEMIVPVTKVDVTGTDDAALTRIVPIKKIPATIKAPMFQSFKLS
jgi:RecB family endonuclease NucS